MNKAIFDTPFLSTLFRWIATVLMRLAGWKVMGSRPDEQKFVLIAAPHTSNWDLFYMINVAFIFNIKIYWMGKSSLFKFPFSGMMRWLGGVPVDRENPIDVVEQMVNQFNQKSSFVLAVPPEGTRSKTNSWKTGFYRIALASNVPIGLGFLDYQNKVGGLGPMFFPTGNMELDIKEIKLFYKDKIGKYPKQFSNVE